MSTLLVTGGMGFIGSNFVRYVLNNDHQLKVINVDKLTYAGNASNLENIEEKFGDRYKFYRADICDLNAISRIFSKESINFVINFAAESHVDRSITDCSTFCETNFFGTQVLLSTAKNNNVTKYLQISTDEVYGSLNFEAPPFTEDSPLKPNNPYSASKASADLMVLAFFKTYGLAVNITRCSNNYGPYQFPEKLIPLMINNALKDEKLPVYGRGINIRDWIYVKDHCEAILKVLLDGEVGEIYNIGGNSEISNIDLVKKLLEFLNKPKDLITFVKDRLGHDLRYAINYSKIKSELNWEPKIKFEEGLKMTIQWYLDNNEWLNRVITKKYLNYYKNQYGCRDS